MSIKAYMKQDAVKTRITEIIGEKRAPQFIASVIQAASANELLKDAEPSSVFNAAATAAILDLPINNNLGFAYIVPYKKRQSNGTFTSVAQFQMGYKGFIQLAQRSGQFKTISATRVYEGQIAEQNPLTGYKFDWDNKTSETVIGYAAYFALINGFEKVIFMSTAELNEHGKKFSKTFKNGLWKNDFEAMAIKTVIKLLLSKYAPLSIDMQKAVTFDQAVLGDNGAVDYVDNEADEINKEEERIMLMIDNAKTREQLDEFKSNVPESLDDYFNDKYNNL